MFAKLFFNRFTNPLIERVVSRWSSAWRDALASAIAAALAWILAQHFFGHAHPVFAAISAVVCLAPGLPSHGKQAIGLMVGVATGILVGEAALWLPDSYPLLRIGFATFAAIAIAALYGLAPVVPIQAGVSAVLMLAVGPESAGAVRMLDVIMGAGVGLVFSQILMTPNPIGIIDSSAKELLEKLASGFEKSLEALENNDASKAHNAVQIFSSAHDSLITLENGIAMARNTARWTLRGRFASREVKEIASRYERHAVRLYASALLFSEAFANALRKEQGTPPPSLHERLSCVATRCLALAREDNNTPPTPNTPYDVADISAAPWQLCLEHLQTVESALFTFRLTTHRDTEK
ncbi:MULTISPECIES: aromatic acid exporter family protein [unclassified Pseudomonas]|uniref:FUSC family protein n=1 Tax=unclassified Pseudomonas TaxID=196821 RepID=UPI00075A4EBA|nr:MULTISPECIES: FUSC family protein [unclassified Pseudomonas]KVV06791.1 putative membrane protein [Pseudomonas sp. TAD18]KVV08234.1 putative membrane protein [Pseudomonas sp. TAA207]